MDKLDQEMTHKLIENALSGLEKGEIPPAAAFLAVSFAGMTCPCPEADYHMSRFLFEGIGCPKNAEEGMEMLRRSVDGGWPAAQTELGRRYFEGEGVEQDYAEAVKWFLLAAEQGDTHAANFLVECYMNGLGVEQDDKKALDWLGKILEAERSYYGFDMSEDESWPLDADTDQALEILDENDICVESGKYESYDPNNKGCNIDDPIVITRTEGYVPLEYLVIEFLVSPREMMPVKQALMKDEGRSIDIITVDVAGQEQEYYFDVTAGLKAKEELL
jgi:hypothetical protein